MAVRVTVGLLATIATLAGGGPVLADDFGARQQGQHVYDRAEVLSAADVANLDTLASNLDQAGAPTIVYLRRKEADDQTTRQDARNLMDAWQVESAPGAKDGLVIFLNLKPSDPRHGSAALVAGSAHAADGLLTADRLQTLFDDKMKPGLVAGDTAGAIAAVLSAANVDMQAPAAGPSSDNGPAAQPLLGDLPAGVLDVVAVLLSLAAGGWLVQMWARYRPRSGPPGVRPPSLETPAAVAGALAAGRVSGEGIGVTVVDLARKGALRIEVIFRPLTIQLRVLDRGRATATFERLVMDRLVAESDATGVVPASMVALMSDLRPAFNLRLGATLVEGGLFDRGPARLQTSVVASVLLAAGVVMVIVTVIGQQPLTILGAAVLLGVGAAGLVVGLALPRTTPEGERIAAGWRGLRTGLKSAAPGAIRPVELGALLPLAWALNVAYTMEDPMSAAATAGYWPEWFISGDTPGGSLLIAWRRLLADLLVVPAGQPGGSRGWGSTPFWGGPSDTSSSDSSSSDSSSGGGSF